MSALNIDKILVVGAGTMGQGIAQWFTQQGCQVEILDQFREGLDRAQKLIFEQWDKLVLKGKLSREEGEKFKKNLSFIKNLSEINSSSDLVVEAIFEDADVKKDLFLQIANLVHSKAIFSSNTSGLSITSLAKSLPPERRTSFVGLHFFNPATLMPLVEVVKSPWTSNQLIGGLLSWFKLKGKRPVLCEDRPGFIVNRVNRNFYGEALRVASMNSSTSPSSPTDSHNQKDQEKIYREIDQVMREVGGFKMGPFELMDFIGIDINYTVTQTLWKDFFLDPRFAPHPLQKAMVDSGRLGKKTGQGFYQYEK